MSKLRLLSGICISKGRDQGNQLSKVEAVALFIDKRQRQGLALLSQSRIANHVCEHDSR